MSWLDNIIFGWRNVYNGGVSVTPPQGTQINGLNLAAGATAAFNSATGAYDITVTGQLPAAVQGDILYYNGTSWVVLTPGTSGQFLETLGASANPQWATLTVPAGVYGNGNDGAATLDGSTAVAGMSRSGTIYTQTRDVYFTNLTVNVAETLKPAGYRTFVSGTLSLAGTYSVAGGAGASGAGGAAGGAGAATNTRLGGSSAGQNGGNSGISNSFGGTGGNSSFGTTASANTVPTVDFGLPYDLMSAINGILPSGQQGTTPVVIQGGSGGAGSASCFGGGGGGVGVLVANILTGSGTITAAGGAGFSATQKSGGGGGGVLFVITRTLTGWSGTITAAGGAAGGAGATAGGSGLVVQLAA